MEFAQFCFMMLDFVSLCLNLVETFKFELEFQFIARVSATADPIHYALSIDISITWRKTSERKVYLDIQ